MKMLEDRANGEGLLCLSDDELRSVRRNSSISDVYDVEDTVFARGKFATVRRANHKTTGVQYAAKYIKKRRRAVDMTPEIYHEISVLRKCAPCGRVVRLHEVYETNSDVVLVLELAAGGELQRIFDTDQCLSEVEARRAMRQILEGLSYLHEKNIAHLDLKPQNLLLTVEDSCDDIKLCDFGVSRLLAPGAEVRALLGTPDYVAPEVLSYEPISLATDIWSVGVLAYVLLSGYTPFGGDTRQQTYLNISQCILTFEPDHFGDVSTAAIDFIKSSLLVNPRLRPTVQDLLQHPWISPKNHILPTLSLKTTEPIGTTPKTTPISQHNNNNNDEASSSEPIDGLKLPPDNSEPDFIVDNVEELVVVIRKRSHTVENDILSELNDKSNVKPFDTPPNTLTFLEKQLSNDTFPHKGVYTSPEFESVEEFTRPISNLDVSHDVETIINGVDGEVCLESQNEEGNEGENEAGNEAENKTETVTENEAGTVAEIDAEKVTENESGKVIENETKTVAENKAQNVAENEAEKLIENEVGKVAANETGKVTENETENVAENETENVAENKVQNVVEQVAENEAESKSENQAENIGESKLQNVTEKVAENEAGRVAENEIENGTDNKTENEIENKTDNKPTDKPEDTSTENEDNHISDENNENHDLQNISESIINIVSFTEGIEEFVQSKEEQLEDENNIQKAKFINSEYYAIKEATIDINNLSLNIKNNENNRNEDLGLEILQCSEINFNVHEHNQEEAKNAEIINNQQINEDNSTTTNCFEDFSEKSIQNNNQNDDFTKTEHSIEEITCKLIEKEETHREIDDETVQCCQHEQNLVEITRTEVVIQSVEERNDENIEINEFNDSTESIINVTTHNEEIKEIIQINEVQSCKESNELSLNIEDYVEKSTSKRDSNLKDCNKTVQYSQHGDNLEEITKTITKTQVIIQDFDETLQRYNLEQTTKAQILLEESTVQNTAIKSNQDLIEDCDKSEEPKINIPSSSTLDKNENLTPGNIPNTINPVENSCDNSKDKLFDENANWKMTKMKIKRSKESVDLGFDEGSVETDEDEERFAEDKILWEQNQPSKSFENARNFFQFKAIEEQTNYKTNRKIGQVVKRRKYKELSSSSTEEIKQFRRSRSSFTSDLELSPVCERQCNNKNLQD